MTRELVFAPSYLRDAKRWAKRDATMANALSALHRRLCDDAFSPDLGVHKLKGNLKGLWSCTVAYDLRAVFRFVTRDGKEALELLKLGTHDEVY